MVKAAVEAKQGMAIPTMGKILDSIGFMKPRGLLGRKRINSGCNSFRAAPRRVAVSQKELNRDLILFSSGSRTGNAPN